MGLSLALRSGQWLVFLAKLWKPSTSEIAWPLQATCFVSALLTCPLACPLSPVRGVLTWCTPSTHNWVGSSETLSGLGRFIVPELCFAKAAVEVRQPPESFTVSVQKNQDRVRNSSLPLCLCRSGCSFSLFQLLVKWSFRFIKYSIVRSWHHWWSSHGRLRSWLEGRKHSRNM